MDVEFLVGEKLPFPLNGDGMRLAINPTDNDNGLEILFFILMPNIRLEEEIEFKSHPIRIGILLSEPLVFLLLIVDKIKLDGDCALSPTQWLRPGSAKQRSPAPNPAFSPRSHLARGVQ
jgi:hypothetical protein